MILLLNFSLSDEVLLGENHPYLTLAKEHGKKSWSWCNNMIQEQLIVQQKLALRDSQACLCSGLRIGKYACQQVRILIVLDYLV